MPTVFPRLYQPPFYPVSREPWPVRIFTAFERLIKSRLFGCQMCGTCILPKTAFVCPMTCPRGLRNGPCRGSSQHHCFVNPSCRCTWFDICQRAERQGNLEELLEVNAPLDNRRLGCETLLSSYRLWHQPNRGPNLPDLIKNRPQFDLDRHAFSYSLRQPDWWQGDSQYHPPKYVEPMSRLEARLRAGHFAITAEVAPPREPTSNRISQVARCLKGFVDTLNFTDNPLGVARVSALACALQSLQRRLEPVLQLQTRHRSRYDIEAEVAGAAAVGVRNILCLTDDIGRLGPGPRPRPERNDLDAVQALWMLRRLRDEGIDVDGRAIECPPQYFLGAMASPYAALPRYEAVVSEKKINAGAQFLQTLPIFDLVRFTAWMEALDKRDLLGKVYLMPTVTLFKSPRHARFAANEVPGVYIPVSMMTRLENAVDTQEEGIEIALNLIAHLKDMHGVHGLHILAPGQEELVARLVKESSLAGSVSSAGSGTFCFSKNGGNKSSAGRAVTPGDFSGTMHHSKLDI